MSVNPGFRNDDSEAASEVVVRKSGDYERNGRGWGLEEGIPIGQEIKRRSVSTSDLGFCTRA